MTHTATVLDALRARLHLPSDYALAQRLGVSRMHVSAWRHARAPIPEDQVLQIAELLAASPAYIAACVEADRAKSPTMRAAWADAASRLCIM